MPLPFDLRFNRLALLKHRVLKHGQIPSTAQPQVFARARVLSLFHRFFRQVYILAGTLIDLLGGVELVVKVFADVAGR